MRDLTMLDILEKTASRLPEKVAVIEKDRRLTYGELLRQARSVGGGLAERANRTCRRPVLLYMEKSIECLVSIYGSMYSGGFYVPMDMSTPVERLNSILETLENAIVLTTRREEPFVRKAGCTGELLIFEDILTQGEKRDALQEIRSGILDTDLAYVQFTSGSTGIPKGVAVMHRSLMDYIDAFFSRISYSEADVVGNQSPFYSDMSLRDLFMVAKCGATVCLIPQQYFMTPKKLLQYLDDHRVTLLSWVPTAYRLVSQFDALSKVRPSDLRMFLYSGEVMPKPVIDYWRQHYPDAPFVQLYGPTEITGVCTAYTVEKGAAIGEQIPLGRPLPNTGILLLDEEGSVIPVSRADTPGEICVYGTCLAAGYYNAPEKTEEVFVQNPLVTAYPSLMYKTGDLGKWDAVGNLVFISRKDYQIKHSGKRVELGEVEAAAASVSGIRACCCVHKKEKDELVLFYTGELEGAEISRSMRDKLPKYMIPTIYRRLDELPMLPNGKLNRKLMAKWENE